MKTAAVSVTSVLAVLSSNPALNRMRNTSAFFKKLSLKAEKNWHQNRGAKRRDSIREFDTGALAADGAGSSRRERQRPGIVAEDARRASAAEHGAERGRLIVISPGVERRSIKHGSERCSRGVLNGAQNPLSRGSGKG